MRQWGTLATRKPDSVAMGLEYQSGLRKSNYVNFKNSSVFDQNPFINIFKKVTLKWKWKKIIN